jgi:hypothetical protein
MQTCFIEKIMNELRPEAMKNQRFIDRHNLYKDTVASKGHTIRANYNFWSKRIEQVQSGKAELSLRYWSGNPRKSKQVEFLRLGKDDGVGIQKVRFIANQEINPVVNEKWIDPRKLCLNDGLSFDDYCNWFKGYDLSKPLAIIHFTKFRY